MDSEVHGMHHGEFANYAEHFACALIDGTPHSPDLDRGPAHLLRDGGPAPLGRRGGVVRVAPPLEELELGP